MHTLSLHDALPILKILLDILNEKKFYQKIQIPKSSRIKLKNVYFELEKNLNRDEINIYKFIVNKKDFTSSTDKEIDLTEQIDVDQLNNIKNWIELKKYSAELLSQIKKT